MGMVVKVWCENVDEEGYTEVFQSTGWYATVKGAYAKCKEFITDGYHDLQHGDYNRSYFRVIKVHTHSMSLSDFMELCDNYGYPHPEFPDGFFIGKDRKGGVE